MNKLAEKIILKAIKIKQPTIKTFDNIKRDFLRTNKAIKKIPKKSDLLAVYHKLLKSGKIKQNQKLEKLLTKRAVRTLSGVSIITVLTKPYLCPGECIYCPKEKNMPKSYIPDEPAAARAFQLHFDPYEQVVRRIESLQKNGHPTDKIELIIKGGTWNAYPLKYQYWFILRCFQACNAKTQKIIIKKQNYNPKLKIGQIKKELIAEQKKNERAKHRIIGLTLETRPDFINEKTIWQMREQGCTRVELGAQTVDDKVLKIIKRGHDTQTIKKAIRLLKLYGFKTDLHLMPQLPGSTPSKDLKMLKEIFTNPDYRPDMIKIYPCTVVKNSELYNWFQKGKYKPYSNKQLLETLITFKTLVPRYVRISRLIRDIPSHHIQAGNKITNLRQIIQDAMKKRHLKCNCLRCREVGHIDKKKLKIKNLKPQLFIDKYEASSGTEYFLSFEDKNRNVVFAFCRLRIDKNGLFPAFIRELHTYGQSLQINTRNKKESQHKGFGKRLVAAAEKICKKNNINTLAVISGVGVKQYYKKLGFRENKTYLVKKII